MTQLPSKALPRIGRRSGFGNEKIDLSYPTSTKMDAEYFNKEKNGGDTGDLFPASDSDSIPYYSHPQDEQDIKLSSPYAMFLFKRLVKEGAFRTQEPTGIY